MCQTGDLPKTFLAELHNFTHTKEIPSIVFVHVTCKYHRIGVIHYVIIFESVEYIYMYMYRFQVWIIFLNAVTINSDFRFEIILPYQVGLLYELLTMDEERFPSNLQMNYSHWIKAVGTVDRGAVTVIVIAKTCSHTSFMLFPSASMNMPITIGCFQIDALLPFEKFLW